MVEGAGLFTARVGFCYSGVGQTEGGRARGSARAHKTCRVRSSGHTPTHALRSHSQRTSSVNSTPRAATRTISCDFKQRPNANNARRVDCPQRPRPSMVRGRAAAAATQQPRESESDSDEEMEAGPSNAPAARAVKTRRKAHQKPQVRSFLVVADKRGGGRPAGDSVRFALSRPARPPRLRERAISPAGASATPPQCIERAGGRIGERLGAERERDRSGGASVARARPPTAAAAATQRALLLTPPPPPPPPPTKRHRAPTRSARPSPSASAASCSRPTSSTASPTPRSLSSWPTARAAAGRTRRLVSARRSRPAFCAASVRWPRPRRPLLRRAAALVEPALARSRARPEEATCSVSSTRGATPR